MMSLEAIHRVNDQIAVKAATKKKVPYIPFNADEVDTWPPIKFPNFGTFKPKGWKKTSKTWFVDKTGYGQEGEDALTVERFKTQIRDYISEHPGYGFAITEEGPCQVYVSAFSPVKK